MSEDCHCSEAASPRYFTKVRPIVPSIGPEGGQLYWCEYNDGGAVMCEQVTRKGYPGYLPVAVHCKYVDGKYTMIGTVPVPARIAAGESAPHWLGPWFTDKEPSDPIAASDVHDVLEKPAPTVIGTDHGILHLDDLQAAMKGVDPWAAYKYNRDNEGNAPVTTSPERVDAILEEVLDRCPNLTSCFNDLWDAHKRLKRRVKRQGARIGDLEDMKNLQQGEIANLQRRMVNAEESNTCLLASVEELTKRVNVPVVRPECVVGPEPPAAPPYEVLQTVQWSGQPYHFVRLRNGQGALLPAEEVFRPTLVDGMDVSHT